MGDARAARWTKPLLLLLFVGGLALFFALGGRRLLSLEALQQNRELLLGYVERHYAASLAGAVAAYALAVALSIPGAVVLSLAAGLLFGRWVGTGVILLGATAGATLVFLAARHLFAGAFERWLGERGRRLVEGFRREGLNYLLFLRLVPLFPFWMVNLAAAFTALPLRTYVAATAIGILPGSFVFANLGGSLGRIESADELLSTEVVLALALLGALALLPVLVKRLRSSHGERR